MKIFYAFHYRPKPRRKDFDVWNQTEEKLKKTQYTKLDYYF